MIKQGATPMKAATKKEIAEVILAMNYGELIRACESMLAIKRTRTADTREDLASILYEWANAQ